MLLEFVLLLQLRLQALELRVISPHQASTCGANPSSIDPPTVVDCTDLLALAFKNHLATTLAGARGLLYRGLWPHGNVHGCDPGTCTWAVGCGTLLPGARKTERKVCC